jgi:indole-3-glycerol phosphate synthase
MDLVIMSDILKTIVEHKKQQIAQAEAQVPLPQMRERTRVLAPARSLAGALYPASAKKVNVIAEIKRASPSKGLIRADLEADAYARYYQQGQAAALSVLTDERFFHGSADDLTAAREVVSLPILRKEFIIAPYQMYESKVLGADAVLLIARILEPAQLKELLDLAEHLEMEALVEIHSEEDFEKVDATTARLIGINNRNLQTFDTDLRTAAEMVGCLNPDQIAVAASGIHGSEDIANYLEVGIHNFLIGESLVRAADPVSFLKELQGAVA